MHTIVCCGSGQSRRLSCEKIAQLQELDLTFAIYEEINLVEIV